MRELEKAIERATNENLTSDNWQYILDTCDLISSDPELNTKLAVRFFKARLAKKDANVLLRTLTLVIAAAENCGSRMQQELTSLSFLRENLLEKLADKKLHKDLKFRIVEVIEQLYDSLKGDPSLKAIHDAHDIVHKKYKKYLKSSPDKPAKFELTAQDKKLEDLELERALKLSVQEYEREQNVRKTYLNSKPLPSTVLERESNVYTSETPDTHFSGTIERALKGNDTATIANVKRVCALYDLISYEPDELSFRKGDIINVIESVYRDWWRGSLSNGKIGIFPLNYVTPVTSKSREEISREKKMEKTLIEVELRKVDKLLALLSSNWDAISEEEVTDLYNKTTHVKPVVAKMIENHSVRKDELKALNDLLNREIKAYNELVERTITNKNRLDHQKSLIYPANEYSLGSETPQLNDIYLRQQSTSAGFGNENHVLTLQYLNRNFHLGQNDTVN